MRPILLEIEGLQSYKEKQVIDFEKLCENGLFGIFGETGSRKSTILDAMIFSLYGDIPRASELASEKNGLKNFLNTSSKKMEVYFKFALDEDIYEISRKYALGKSKGEEELKRKEITLKKNGELVADSVTKLENIIKEDFGLSIDDFTRTVVLPQGKFSEFVKLKGSEKRAMLENIFAMERYGKALQEKIKKELDYWKAKDEELEEELAELEDVTAEKIEELEKERTLKNKEVELKKEEHKKVEKRYYELKNLKEEIEKYNEQLGRKKALEDQREDIEYIKKQLIRGKNANEIRVYIDKLEGSQRERYSLQRELEDIETQKEKLQKEVESLEKGIELQKEQILLKEREKSQIHFDKGEEDSITEVIRYKESLKYEMESLERTQKNMKLTQEEISNSTEELLDKTGVLNLKVEELKTLPEVSREVLEKYRDEIEEYQRVIREYKEKSSLKVGYLNKLENLEKELESVMVVKEELDTQLEVLEGKRKENLAYELAKDLKEGEPCPVCGSVHHVKVEHGIGEDIEKIQGELKKINEKRSLNIAESGKLNGSINSLKESIENLKVVYQEKVVDESSYQTLISKKMELEDSYREEEKRLESLMDKKNRLNAEVVQLKEKCKNIQINIERAKVKCEEYSAEIDGFTKKIEDLQALILKFGEEFAGQEKEKLEERREKLRENYKRIQGYEQEIAKLNKKIDMNNNLIVEIKNRLEKIKTGVTSYQVKISGVDSQIKELNEKIDELVSKYDFVTLEEVKESYISESEIDEYTRKIEIYGDNLNAVNTLLNDLESRVQGKEFSIELWEEISKLKESLNQEILDSYKGIEQLSNEIELQKNQLADSNEKKKEQKEIRKKRSMAEDLNKKFNKGGFLNFLTTKKLKGVIENASYYVNRITNGRYRLYTDDECNFYVIDMFNDGIKRKVGTLSGGEIFVVSLCLALALSKQLQLKGKIPLEFFFLDEGFGSLDSNLLDKVMEAIEGIRKEENIKIGIITHLEDLKVRIDKKLQVEKAVSGERGTRVRII